MVEEINTARKANESLGGVYEVIAFGVTPGIGSYVAWDERLDGRLAQAIMSIQAMKGVGIGDGFDLAGRPGSQAHDEIFYSEEHGFARETNRAGGLEGGMTTGTPLVVRGAMKPLPTLTKPLRSVDLETHEPAAGAARAHRLVHGPGRRRGGRGDGGAGAGARPTRRSWAATTSTTPAPRCAPTRSASVGGARPPGGTGLHRVHGRRQVQSGARTVAAELGVQPLDSDRELEAELGETIEAFFDREGEQAFREREEATVLRLLGRAGGGAVALGGGSLQSERVRDALRLAHGRAPGGRARRGLAARGGEGPPAGPRPRPLRPAARGPRGAVRVDRPRHDPADRAARRSAARCRR